MDTGSVVVAVTGVVVSGVVGPTTATLISRGNDSRKARRESANADREELRRLLDEAAVLLASGPRYLRVGQAPHGRQALDAWAAQVAQMGQRLQLRLPTSDPIVQTYQQVVVELMRMAEHTPTEDADFVPFETARDAYLSASRDWLTASQLRRKP